MVKNRSLSVREGRLRSVNWLMAVGMALLSAIAGPVSAGQVIDDEDAGSSQQQAPVSSTRSGGGGVSQPFAVQQYPSEQSRTDGQSTKQIIANEIGRAIGQAVVQSIVQQGNQPAPSSSRSYIRTPEPSYPSGGGRRAKDERF
jgi:hypothetical protein